ncbi:Gfo/Idh/MocA family oxidoreductase [Enterococcus asini]|uniref:Gfo/Idh/MocA family protein n=1 Tax=Enterococcus asini TaxID=57732 RepID=UPI0032E3EE5F
MKQLTVIGLGNMGMKYLRDLATKPFFGWQVSGQTTSPEKVVQLQAEFPGMTVYQSFNEVIANLEVTAVLIATPNRFHFSMAKASLNAGKHVLLEKPAALSIAEIEELTDLANKQHLVCDVMFQTRFSPVFQWLKQHLPELGDLQRFHWEVPQYYRPQSYFTKGNWTGTWEKDGGGILLNQAIHQLDLVNFLFGLPEKLVSQVSFGRYREIEVEDEAVLLLKYREGLLGTFVASLNEPLGQERLEIIGEKGSVRYEGQQLTWQTPEQTTTITFTDNDQRRKSHRAVIERFLQEITESGIESRAGRASSGIPASENQKDFQLIHGALLSTWEERWIELPIDGKALKTVSARIGH